MAVEFVAISVEFCSMADVLVLIALVIVPDVYAMSLPVIVTLPDTGSISFTDVTDAAPVLLISACRAANVTCTAVLSVVSF
ncbi:hypothetical protein Barb7_01382 [Bacteroidales bacterium Barb7]|nr:hypothetical protein Barb7_01382 [Bacteroidales bacterium Barb7]